MLKQLLYVRPRYEWEAMSLNAISAEVLGLAGHPPEPPDIAARVASGRQAVIKQAGGPGPGRRGTGDKIRPGMTLAIEPMVNLGDCRTKTLSDGWTVVTVDGSPSAHFEHTVLTTDQGPEILTVSRSA